jgi:hypothetical protein
MVESVIGRSAHIGAEPATVEPVAARSTVVEIATTISPYMRGRIWSPRVLAELEGEGCTTSLPVHRPSSGFVGKMERRWRCARPAPAELVLHGGEKGGASGEDYHR